MRKIKLALYALLVSISAAAWSAEAVSLVEVLSGKAFPLTVTMKELTPEWRRFSLGTQGGGGQVMMMMAMLEATGLGNATYYTRAQTVEIAGETFLVAYSRPRKAFDPRIFQGEEPPLPEPITLRTQLSLSLLNLRTMGNLCDIRPFDIQAELAVNAQQQDWVTAQERKAKEATLKANLHQLRNAIAQFEADTGVYPAKLEDIVAGKEAQLAAHVPAKSYVGPYLTPKGGIAGTGIPLNPFVDMNAAAPDPKQIATHWRYDPQDGIVRVSDVTANLTTLDGERFGDL